MPPDERPVCLCCGAAMTLFMAVPRYGAHRGLQSFSCDQCKMVIVREDEASGVTSDGG